MFQSARNKAEIDENEFIDACRMIYDGVRDVRYNYTVNVDGEETGLDSDMEEAAGEVESRKSGEKEKTTIQEAVSKIKTEKICTDLTSNSPVYWVAVWSNPEVRTEQLAPNYKLISISPSFNNIIQYNIVRSRA